MYMTTAYIGGKVVHSICILTALDLGEIEKFGINSKQPVFFFNKYIFSGVGPYSNGLYGRKTSDG